MKIHCELWSLANLPVLRREKLKEIIHIYELVVHTACFVIALSRNLYSSALCVYVHNRRSYNNTYNIIHYTLHQTIFNTFRQIGQLLPCWYLSKNIYFRYCKQQCYNARLTPKKLMSTRSSRALLEHLYISSGCPHNQIIQRVP